MKLTVAEVIAKTFKKFGVDRVFMLTGGDHPLWIALKKHGIKLTLTRSEKSSAYIADGYARATGRIAVIYGQSGPGAANLSAGLPEPFWAQSPILALTSCVREKWQYRYAYQELEQKAYFDPVTNWNKQVIIPERIVDLLRRAILTSMKDPKGPVHLTLPRDYFGREIEVDERWFKEETVELEGKKPAADGEKLREALKILNKAERPLILAGSGCVSAGAGEELLEIVESLQIPVITSLGGKGIISEQHPLVAGVVGRYSRKVANDIFEEADCVLSIGSRMGGLVTDGYRMPDNDAAIIRMEIDPYSLNTPFPEELSIICDARKGLAQLVELIGQHQYKRHTSWADNVKKRIKVWEQNFLDVQIEDQQSPLDPHGIYRILNSVEEKITVVADTGYAAAWSGVLYCANEPQSYYRSMGSLGWGFPGSLGIQLAYPDRRVVCITGDGGFGYHISDLETAVRLNIPVIVIVINNSSLCFEYHGQKYRFKNQVIDETNEFSDLNYGNIAREFGAEGVQVASQEEFRKAYKKALDNNQVTLIDVLVDREVLPPVTNYEKIFKRMI